MKIQTQAEIKAARKLRPNYLVGSENQIFALMEFSKGNELSGSIELKDGRVLFTTSNGFEYFVITASCKINQVSEEYHNAAKANRVTKRSKRQAAL